MFYHVYEAVVVTRLRKPLSTIDENEKWPKERLLKNGRNILRKKSDFKCNVNRNISLFCTKYCLETLSNNRLMMNFKYQI